MKFILLLAVIVLGISSTYAQGSGITGKVTDKTGEGIPGVAVVVKENRQIGTITNIDGLYELNMPTEAKTLIFSFVGMTSQEIEIGSSAQINVVMEDETQDIGEVMVVAYGKATKSSFTGSAEKVTGEKLAGKNTSEFTKALAGEVAGVKVINGTGQPGSTATIRIRGFGSVNSDCSPLYVVDGVPYSGSLSSIAPSDIASTTILKDATATALYGSRGANGVILITTKKGQSGQAKFEVDLRYGVNVRMLPYYETLKSPEQFVEFTWEGLYNQYQINPDLENHSEMESRIWASEDLFSDWGIHPYYNLWNVDGKNVVDPTTGRMNPNALRRYNPGSWSDEMFRNGSKREATLKISGGSDRSSYFTSFGFLQDEGYYTGSDFKRFNVRSNLSNEGREWFKSNVGLAYSYNEMNDPGQGGSANNGFNFVNNIPSIYPVYERDEEGNIVIDETIGGPKYDYGFGTDRSRGFSANINPAGAVLLDVSENISHQISGNSVMEAQLSKKLKFSTTFGVQVLARTYSGMDNMFYGDAAGLGRISKSNSVNLSYTWNQILSYNFSINKHNFETFVAHENTLTQNKSQYGSMSEIASPYSVELSNGIIKGGMSSSTIEYALESYFGQLKYDFENKYFLHLNIRRDGTSRFPNDKWGTFGSAGLAWMMTKESFLSSVSWLKQLKYKISYGVLGNQSLGIYPTFDSYGIHNLNDELSVKFSAKGNPNLTWEQSKNFNTGFESKITDRYSFDIEYYRKITDNLLYYKQVAPSLGYASYPVNDGRMLNSGFEFNLMALLVQKSDFSFNVGLNGGKYNNKILTMPVDDTTGKPKPIELQGAYAYAKGRSRYDFYMREWAGVDPTTGEANWYRYYNENSVGEKEYILDMATYESENTINKLGKEKTNDYNQATKKFIDKSVVPTIEGGLSLNLVYKNWSFDMQYAYGFGGHSYDNSYAMLMSDHAPGANNWHIDMYQRWQKEGDVTDVPRLTANYDKYDAALSTRFVTSNTYFNLNNARISYNFPSAKIQQLNLSGLSLWMAGDNIFMLTSRKGFVPNTSESGNSSSYSYTPLSSFTAGVKVQF